MLRGACLDVADKKLHYIVATNGRALYSANSFAFDLQKSVIIPESKFLNWTDLMDEGCKLAVEPPTKGSSQGYIQLASDRWTYITREIDGRYPNWKQAVPVMASPKTVIKLPSQAVKQLQEVLPHLPGNEDLNRVIRLKFEFGQLKVEGHAPAGDWTGVFIQDATITGKPVWKELCGPLSTASLNGWITARHGRSRINVSTRPGLVNRPVQRPGHFPSLRTKSKRG